MHWASAAAELFIGKKGARARPGHRAQTRSGRVATTRTHKHGRTAVQRSPETAGRKASRSSGDTLTTPENPATNRPERHKTPLKETTVSAGHTATSYSHYPRPFVSSVQKLSARDGDTDGLQQKRYLPRRKGGKEKQNKKCFKTKPDAAVTHVNIHCRAPT